MSALPASNPSDKEGGQRSDRAVFLSDFVHVAVAFDELAPVLLDPKMAWLHRLAAGSPGEEVVAGPGARPPEIGESGGAPAPPSGPTTGESAVVDGAPPSPPASVAPMPSVPPALVRPGGVTVLAQIGPAKRPAQAVWVSAGPARQHSGCVITPVFWDPGRHERLLPKLDADLELSHLDGPYSRLALSGRYRVPLAQVGLSLDRIALHHLAEASFRRFLWEAEASILAGR